MNRLIADPFQSTDLPEHIEEFLDFGFACCTAFNRSGTLLAAGCKDGNVVVWDFETRGVAAILQGHKSSVDCIEWSKNGRSLVTASSDQTVAQWDVLSGSQTASVQVDNTVIRVSVSRADATKVCVSCATGPPLFVDMAAGTTQPLPLAFFEGNLLRWKPADLEIAQNCRAVFGWDGALIYVSAPKATLLVVATETLGLLDIVKVGGSASILGLEVAKKGRSLLVNSHDRVIRLFSISPAKPSDLSSRLRSLREQAAISKPPSQGSLMGADGLLTFRHAFQNAVEKMQWKAVTFSQDLEYIVAAALSKTEHLIYIWSINGPLARILEGPAEGVSAVQWHPLSSMLLSLSANNGRVYIWSKIYNENWSAFAPDFRELDQNTEYIEREDEFDIVPEKAEQKDEIDKEEGEELDIDTMDTIRMFSSDDDDDEAACLKYLPIRAADILAGGPEALFKSVSAEDDHDKLQQQQEQAPFEQEDDGPAAKQRKCV